MTAKRFVTLLVFVLLAAGGASAQKVSVDFDKDADFSKYSTFTVALNQSQPPRDPLMAQRALKGVTYHLTLKGLREVEATPDTYVVLYGIREEQKELNITGYGYGPGWRRGGGSATGSVTTYMVGTLVVDIYDATTKQLVWRGTASDTLSDKPEKNEKKLNKALDKLFKKFPPQGK